DQREDVSKNDRTRDKVRGRSQDGQAQAEGLCRRPRPGTAAGRSDRPQGPNRGARDRRACRDQLPDARRIRPSLRAPGRIASPRTGSRGGRVGERGVYFLPSPPFGSGGGCFASALSIFTSVIFTGALSNVGAPSLCSSFAIAVRTSSPCTTNPKTVERPSSLNSVFRFTRRSP